MTISKIGATTAALTLLAWPSISSAGPAPAIPGSVSNVTLALTFTYRAPGTFHRDAAGKIVKPPVEAYENEWHVHTPAKMTEENTFEYVSKMKTQKFGNKELLLQLIEAGILPEHGTTPFIAGWSIVLVSATLPNEEAEGDGYYESSDSKFYAVHKTEGDIVDLSDVILPEEEESGYAEKGAYKDYFKDVDGAHPQSIHTVTWAFSWKESISLLINFAGPVGVLGEPIGEPEFFAKLHGIFTQSDKFTTVGPDKKPVIVSGAGKLANISGAGPVLDEDEEADRSVAEGSLTLAAGKATLDVSGYPNLIDD